jgi:predicted dinucleotide-binding enzyme
LWSVRSRVAQGIGNAFYDQIVIDDTTVRLQANPHIRRIVVWEKPVSATVQRINQCVPSTGVVRNVRSITAAT